LLFLKCNLKMCFIS